MHQQTPNLMRDLQPNEKMVGGLPANPETDIAFRRPDGEEYPMSRELAMRLMPPTEEEPNQ